MKAPLSLLSISLAASILPAAATPDFATWRSLTPGVSDESEFMWDMSSHIRDAWRSPIQPGRELRTVPEAFAKKAAAKNKWEPFPSTTVQFTIQPSGEVAGVKTIASSNDTKFDSAAIKAVSSAAPYCRAKHCTRVQMVFSFAPLEREVEGKIVRK